MRLTCRSLFNPISSTEWLYPPQKDIVVTVSSSLFMLRHALDIFESVVMLKLMFRLNPFSYVSCPFC